MRLRDHWLEGEGIVRRPTPNRGGALAPRFLVFHYTAGGSAESSVEWLCSPAARASAHLVMARDGRIYQLAPFNVRTWHAGESRWAGLSGLNAWSIGIEMANAGRLAESEGGFRTWFRAAVPAAEALRARHKNEAEEASWHRYTERQIGRAGELARLLAGAYGIEDVLGHDDIAPGRKADPGPAFPLAEVRALALASRRRRRPWAVEESGAYIGGGTFPLFLAHPGGSPRRSNMADTIRTVDYYNVMGSDKPGAGAKMLEPFRQAGVSFLAVHAFPEGSRVQVDLVPAKGADFLRVARREKVKVSPKKKAFLIQGTDRTGALAGVLGKLGEAGINVTAVTGLCAGGRRFAAILWVKPKDQRAASKALGAKG